MFRKSETDTYTYAESNPEEYYASMTVFGFFVVLCFVALLFARGHLQNVFAHISFFGSQKWEGDVLYGYDYCLVLSIKTIVSLYLIALAYR